MKNKTYEIKVCGMRDAENIRAVDALGVDYIGMIFYPHSPRYVSAMPHYLPSTGKRVGVFVNATMKKIMETVQSYKLDYIQLHGTESPEFCRRLFDRGLHLIKAFSVSDSSDIEKTGMYEDICEIFLFDTKSSGYGGAGKVFDWNILKEYKGSIPFLLSGGISLDNVNELNDFHHPRLKGFDLNSKFEISPAVKDINALKKFLDKLP